MIITKIIWAANLCISVFLMFLTSHNYKKGTEFVKQATAINKKLSFQEESEISTLCALLLAEYEKNGFPDPLPAPIVQYLARQSKKAYEPQ